MAEANVSVAQDDFSCPICLDLLKSPVATACGHSFCMDCITACWDVDEPKGVYSCPQCKQTFAPRPVLRPNTILSNMVEVLKKSGIMSNFSTPKYAEPGDVECNVCSGRKRKALKSCLVCLSSYCETHAKAHNDLFPSKRHKMIEADGKLEYLICSQHGKLLEVFCRTDQTCICLRCVMDEHSGHKTVSVAAERMKRQKELGQSQRKCHQIIQEKEKLVQELKDAVGVMKQSARAAVEDSERIFAELIRSIKRTGSEVTKLIRDQKTADVTRAEERVETLEQEIAELKRRHAQLIQLSKTQDHTSFLQSLLSLRSLTDRENPSDAYLCSDVSFEKVSQSVSQLKDQLEDFLKQGAGKITETAEQISLFLPWEPLTRSDFLQYSRRLRLDRSTAHGQLYVSGRNEEVACKDVKQQRPNYPERFTCMKQVLCQESVSGRRYWEVEWSGLAISKREVFVALSSKDTPRKGGNKAACFGYNQHSWSLSCSSSSCSIIHNGEVIDLNVVPSNRIGVYVDHKAGLLAFYSIHGDRMTLLQKIQTTFPQPLYPGFWLGQGSKVNICN